MFSNRVMLTCLASFLVPGLVHAETLLPDQLDLTTDQTVLANTATIQAEVGQAVDDSYDGIISFKFSINMDAFGGSTGDSSTTFAGFQLFNGTNESVGIGDAFPTSTWHVYRVQNIAGPTGFFELQDATDSPVTIAINSPQSFELLIDYNAAADDDATVFFNGKANTLASGDYSFDEIRGRIGLSGSGAQVDYFDMSIAAQIPEPGSLAALSLGGLMLGARRRRR